jgi:hypothetical protein
MAFFTSASCKDNLRRKEAGKVINFYAPDSSRRLRHYRTHHPDCGGRSIEGFEPA